MGLDIYLIKNKRSEIGYFRKVNFLVKFFEKKGFDVSNQTPLVIKKEDAEELLCLTWGYKAVSWLLTPFLS